MERIGIVGAGRAGTAVGAALVAAGYPVTGVSARSRSARDRAARLLPGVPVLAPAELVPRADLVVVAVPDQAISTVAAELPLRTGQYVLHLCGAHGLSVLPPGPAVPIALHPPMTFTDVGLGGSGWGRRQGTASLADVVFTATAPESARELVERLVKSLGAKVQWVAEEERARYHAGLVHGANHLVTLVTQALGVLREAGIGDPAETLRPLLAATLDNTLRSGHDALTGPVARGDTGTVAAHLAVLDEPVRRTYAELARATVELSAAGGRLDPATVAEFGEVLDGCRTGEAQR